MLTRLQTHRGGGPALSPGGTAEEVAEETGLAVIGGRNLWLLLYSFFFWAF